jgi:tryptophanyl-tRNA synthetase
MSPSFARALPRGSHCRINEVLCAVRYTSFRNAVKQPQARALGSSSPSQADTRPKKIFSGIQPTGVPHLGNYLGALQQWVRLQNESSPATTTIYSLVDLHAITIRQDPAQLRRWKDESLAMLLAIGLDPKRSIIFHQSDVPAHTELMWILSCQASTGYLGRMTQWKDKTAGIKEGSDRLKLGLFSYPVLQAADVLVHGATHVPVGHDQAQHLEFARHVANGFNEAFGPRTGPSGSAEIVLIPPETLISPAKRVMSLMDPEKKMSKSHPNPKSRILLTDSDELIRSKIKGAVTDSIEGITFEPERRPGVSNLVEILAHATAAAGSPTDSSSMSLDDIAKDMHSSSMRALKDRVADAVCGVIGPIREKCEAIIQDQQALDDVAAEGAEKARASAAGTIERVKRTIGLL